MQVIIIILISFSANLFAVEIPLGAEKTNQPFLVKNLKAVDEEFEFSFNLQKYQLLQQIKTQTTQEASELQKKSGIKATLLSALIPGAGEFYAESYWKSALFAVIEVAAWTGYFTYENKGDSKDLEMRRFGDVSWSEDRYWSRVYDLAINADKWEGAPLNPGSDGILPTNEIESNIETLRALESGGDLNKHFSHSLPRTKTQQYYEMIYKYPSQFGAGWKELGEDWGYYDYGANLDNLTPDVRKYKKLRNTSNDFYATATDIATVVLFNHLASAIDAAFSVKNYNTQLNYSLYAGQKYYAGERVNTYGLALSW